MFYIRYDHSILRMSIEYSYDMVLSGYTFVYILTYPKLIKIGEGYLVVFPC